MLSAPTAADAPSPLAIAVQHVSKTYRVYERPEHRLHEALFGGRRRHTEFHALQDVSFDVRRGETVGIIGVNGSGKSTLLQIVCGTLGASAGTVVTTGRTAALLELGTGFDAAFTGRENVFLNAAMFGLTRAETAERFDRIAAFADIGTFIDQPVRAYSTGMVVRLAFAVIANLDADVLVVDEALAVGDAFFVQKCMRFLRDFMKRGTLLFVSHDTSAVSMLCDRALWLHKGRVIMDGRAPVVAEAYLECLAEEAWGGHGGDARADAIRRTASTRASTRAPAATMADPAPAAAAPAMPDGRMDLSTVDVTGASFGQGGARIVAVALLDASDRPIQVIHGGDVVTLSVRAEALQRIDAPIVGFVVKDRLGQSIFGDNTFEYYRHEAVAIDAGDAIDARFTFVAPILANGSYAISVAVADGTQMQHIQHHWVHDAVVFQALTNSVATGLMGIPMRQVRLDVLSPHAAS